MIIRSIVFSITPPAFHNVLWIKAGDNNINDLLVYDGGWKKIGTSSGGGTSDYNDLENKPKINNIVLEGNLSLKELGIIIPDLKNYITEDALNTALLEYAKKSDIPSIEGLLSETEAQELYQPKGNYALKSEIPDITDLATKTEVTEAISNQKFKTINNQEITGEGNIEIQGGGSSITVDAALNETSVNPVQNKVITEAITQANSEIEKKQPKGDYALKTEVPTKVSDLTNDAGFQTAADVASATENLATKTELGGKQDVLVSGTTIKTVNGNSILGEGNIEIQGGSTVTVDDALNAESVNPVQNKVITEQINTMKEWLAQLDEKVFPTTLSVSGGGTYDEGTSQTVTVSWKLMKNGQTLTPDSVTVNEESVDPSVSYKVFTDVTTTTTYNVSVVYGGKTYKGSTTATFKKTYYRYYGALPVGTSVGSITESMITSLKKEVCTSASATLTYNLEDQRAAYAYPSTFGLLTKVLDDATSLPYDDFVKEEEMVIDGENYYIYALQNPSSVTDYKFRFVK